MDARYSIRKHQLLEECPVAPEICDQVLPRLHTFLAPFVKTFQGPVAEQHAPTYGCGLLSDVERQNVESMAHQFGPSRLPLQGFSGWADWDDAPLRQAWLGPVGQPWGQADGVLGCDPSGFPTSGCASVGVARPWCGRLGQVDTCPVALALGDVSRRGPTLVATRLSLPQEWTRDEARGQQAGIPPGRRRYRTRHQVALERREPHGAGWPPRGLAGDDARGRPDGLRRRLAAVGER